MELGTDKCLLSAKEPSTVENQWFEILLASQIQDSSTYLVGDVFAIANAALFNSYSIVELSYNQFSIQYSLLRLSLHYNTLILLVQLLPAITESTSDVYNPVFLNVVGGIGKLW